MSHQGLPLKAFLVRCLNRIKTTNSVLKFCDLVRNADYLINQSQVLREEDAHCKHVHSNVESIWEQMKTEFKPRREVALEILQILHVKENTSDLTRKFVSFVSEMDENGQNVKNYLGDLVKIINSLTVSTITGKLGGCYTGLCLEPKRKDIVTLQVYLYFYRMRKTENLLIVLYKIGMKKLDFTEKEKIEVGHLLFEAVEPIDYFIDHTVDTAGSRLRSIFLKFRSALQYFIEVYAKFPPGNKVLDEVVNTVIIKNSIKSLDSLISELWDEYDPYETNSDFEHAGASKVPESHTWWPKNGYKGFIHED